MPDERRHERWVAWEEERPIRWEEGERGRESKRGQDQYRRSEIGSTRREDLSRGRGRRGSHLDMNNRESLERISFRKDGSGSKEVRERRRSLFEEASWNGHKSPRRVFDRREEKKDQYQRKVANKDLGSRGSKERSHKSNDERSFSREDEKISAEKSRDRERREMEKGDRRRSERERKERTRSPRSHEERRRSSRTASDEKKRASLREEEQKRVETDNMDRIRREKERNKERKLGEVKVSVSLTRKRSEDSRSDSEKKRRCSRELSSSKELVEKTPYIRLGNEEKLDKKEGDEDVLNKSLPGDSISVEAGAASITKEDVTELAEAAEEVASQAEVLKEVTAHTGPQAEVLEPEVAPHTPQGAEAEEVTSQATLEMSVEDESVQEEDPFAEERKEVLHELEVVAIEKDAKHALMEKLKSQIRQLEVSTGMRLN